MTLRRRELMLDAVSYTHLDVYKRQRLKCAAIFFQESSRPLSPGGGCGRDPSVRVSFIAFRPVRVARPLLRRTLTCLVVRALPETEGPEAWSALVSLYSGNRQHGTARYSPAGRGIPPFAL